MIKNKSNTNMFKKFTRDKKNTHHLRQKGKKEVIKKIYII